MSSEQAAVLARVQGAAIDGRLRVLRIRQKQLISLQKALVQHRIALLDAIQDDEGYSEQEAKLIFGSTLIDLRNHYDALDFESEFKQEYALAKQESNEARRVPFEIAYIIPSPFTVLFSIVSALSAALEAGTCVVIELDQTHRKTPALLQRVPSSALDRDMLGFVSSRAPAEFLAHCVIVDQVGKMSASSSQHLLASDIQRNVAVIDRTGDMTLAAKEIVASCTIFEGASPYAVDLVFVNEFMSDAFVQALGREMAGNAKTTRLGNGMSPSSNGRELVNTSGKYKIQAEVTSGKAQLMLGTCERGVVNILYRSSTLMTSKRLGLVIAICKMTSLDDLIDVLNVVPAGTSLVGALYVFSGAREAKYLSQHIKSNVSYIDHIPSQLTVGPPVPFGYSTNLRCRYTSDMFETPSPQVVAGAKTHLTSTILHKADFIDKIAQKPLRPTGQAPSGAWGFFEQGIILGALVYLVPIVSLTTLGAGYAVWGVYQGLIS